jgi:hypothetical protein
MKKHPGASEEWPCNRGASVFIWGSSLGPSQRTHSYMHKWLWLRKKKYPDLLRTVGQSLSGHWHSGIHHGLSVGEVLIRARSRSSSCWMPWDTGPPSPWSYLQFPGTSLGCMLSLTESHIGTLTCKVKAIIVGNYKKSHKLPTLKAKIENNNIASGAWG